MTSLLKKTIRTSKILMGIFALSILLFSCEPNELTPNLSEITFNIPEYYTTGKSLELSVSKESGDKVEWNISDGSTYTDFQVSHTFTEVGDYTIQLKTYSGGIETASIKKDISVYFDSKSVSENSKTYALATFYSEGKFLIPVLKETINAESNEPETRKSYLLVDNKLNITNELETLEEVGNEFEASIILNDTLIGFSTSSNTSNSLNNYLYSNILSNSNTIGKKSVFNYSDGFIYQSFDEYSTLSIKYTSNTSNCAWKVCLYEDKSSKYLFNIDDRLFYLSFSNSTDEAYIVKFKNPSVQFQQATYNLNAEAKYREELFAISNPFDKNISFASYNSQENTTTFYKIDDNCSISTTCTKEGKFAGTPLFVSIDGSVYIAEDSKIVKYNSNWEVIAEKELETTDFHYTPVSDNLFLLAQNLESGELKLSFLNKHFDPVRFE